jgi:hypothetical protein
MGFEIAGVEAFDDADARILSQLAVKLAMAHIERYHMGRPALEQHLCESACRSANIETQETMR